MKSLLTSSVGVALLMTVAIPGGAQPPMSDPTKEGEYFPTAEGTTWTYEAAGGMLVTVKVVKLEKSIERTINKEKVSCTQLQTSINNMPVSSELVAVGKDGVYRVAVGGQEVDPPLRFLKFPFKKGENWPVKCEIGDRRGMGGVVEKVVGQFVAGEEEITVDKQLAEKLKAEKVKVVTAKGVGLKVNDQAMELTYYFAPNVGMIRQEAVIGGVKVDLKLKKFEGPREQ